MNKLLAISLLIACVQTSPIEYTPHHATSYTSISHHIDHHEHKPAPIYIKKIAPVYIKAHHEPASSYASVDVSEEHHGEYHHAPVEYHHPIAVKTVEVDHHPKYKFAYGVEDKHTGDIKSQHEERDGDVVKGKYTVLDPDGTHRTVHYTADHHNGFNAVVERTGHAVHPSHHVTKAIVAPVAKVVGYSDYSGGGSDYSGYSSHHY